MLPHRSPLIAGVLVAAFALSGCVAGFIPVVAGGALAGADISRERREARDLTASGELEASQGEVATNQAGLATTGNQVPASIREGALITPGSNAGEFTDLLTYAREQAGQILLQTGENAPPASTAVLSNPAALDGKRDECGERTPTVLIDLDPGDDPFMPPSAPAAQPALAAGLANLRALGLEITWLSANSAADAGKVRRALHASGLDPEKSDNLLLMRYQADRKQTRRGELSETHCIVAIAGDTRSDFDELYDYLLKPEAAFALEPIIGNGWFLIPPVLGQN